MEQDEIKTLDTQEHPEKEQEDLTIPESLDDNLEKAIEVFGNLPKDQRAILSRGMLAIQQSYSGPLPPAKEFKGYKEVLPDAPERILTMAERNNDSRIQLTKNLKGMSLSKPFWDKSLDFFFQSVSVVAQYILEC